MSDLKIREVAAELNKSHRWLSNWLQRNPLDRHGRCYFMGNGRSMTFTRDDIVRIRFSIQDEAAEKMGSFRPTGAGWIYFIEGGDWIKIGFTRNGSERLKKMATNAPVELRFLHVEPGTFRTEKLIHREFADLRTRGEWFRKDARLLAHIEQRKQIVGSSDPR